VIDNRSLRIFMMECSFLRGVGVKDTEGDTQRMVGVDRYLYRISA